MRKNRRFFAVMAATALTMGALSACQSQPTETTAVTESTTASETTVAETTAQTKAEETTAAESKGVYTPGTYSATVTGMREMTVSVTFSADAITDIQIEHEETPGIGAPVCESMPAQILEIQGLGIDSISGATLTSNAVLAGVEGYRSIEGCEARSCS